MQLTKLDDEKMMKYHDQVTFPIKPVAPVMKMDLPA